MSPEEIDSHNSVVVELTYGINAIVKTRDRNPMGGWRYELECR